MTSNIYANDARHATPVGTGAWPGTAPGCYIVKDHRPNLYSGGSRAVYWEPITEREAPRGSRAAVAVRWLLLPYGVLQAEGQREVLVNRNYDHLWERVAGGPAVRGIAGVRLSRPIPRNYFYTNDMTEAARVAVGRRVLEEWGIVVPAKLADWVRKAVVS